MMDGMYVLMWGVYRDDLTVEVIFFGEGDRSGNVVVNEPATSLNKKQS